MNLQYLQRVSDTLDVIVWFPGSERRQTREDYFCPADWAPGVRCSCDNRWKHHHILHTDCNKDTSLCSRCLSLNATVVPKTRMHLTFTHTASGCVGDVCTAHVNVRYIMQTVVGRRGENMSERCTRVSSLSNSGSNSKILTSALRWCFSTEMLMILP